jgi:hypothetical protein
VSDAPDDADALVYLDVEDVLEISAAIIGGTPEQAADQLRSRGALEGALGRPANYARYEGADLAAQAAVPTALVRHSRSSTGTSGPV